MAAVGRERCAAGKRDADQFLELVSSFDFGGWCPPPEALTAVGLAAWPEPLP